MTERWARIEALFHDALEHDGDRAAFVAREAGKDEDLRREVLRLLGEHDRDPEFMEEAPSLPQQLPAPEHVGDYELVELLGEGGMGLVYLARQKQPARLVALKLVRPGFVTEDAARRLAAEAEILGRLEHPGIARIYEAGSAEVHGRPQPFFAMERIDGSPIVRFADDSALSTADRVRLMALVCDAVEHAHAQGVVHRDLKPGNVLVDGDGAPHVLDFGVARLTEPDARLATMTDRGRLIGTLPYMAPEQLSGTDDEIDQRSDVYALGVMLYELLGGRRPHDLNDTTLPEAIRRVAEVEPPLLSTFDRQLRGDLEIIAQTALMREPDRRYASAGALGDDLNRYLAREPIHARKPTVGYRLAKLLQRRRTQAGAAAIILVVIVIGTVLTLQQAEESRSRGEQMTETSTLLARVIAVRDDAASLYDRAMEPKLDGLSREADVAFTGQPLGEAQVRETLGDIYYGLGQLDKAAREYRRGAALREGELGRGHSDTLDTLAGVAATLTGLPHEYDAHDLFREVWKGREAALGPNAPKTFRSANDYAMFLGRNDRTDEAIGILQDTWQRQREHMDPIHVDTLTCQYNLARLLNDEDRHEEAEATMRDAVDLLTRYHGEDVWLTLAALGTYGSILKDLGRIDEATPLKRRYVEGIRRMFGETDARTVIAVTNLGRYLFRHVDRAEGLDVLLDLHEKVTTTQGEDGGLVGQVALGAGSHLVTARRFGEAEPILLGGYEACRVGRGEEDRTTRRLIRELERLYRKWDKPDQAAPYRALMDAANENN